jgi:integrase
MVVPKRPLAERDDNRSAKFSQCHATAINNMTRAKGADRPEKPRPDFPLTPHNCGQWVKKIHGKIYHFGTWDDPEGALNEYRKQRDALEGGGVATAPDRITVRLLANMFLESKEQLVDQGDLARQTWNDYKSAGARLTAFFGPARPVASLNGKDFERLRKSFPETWSSIRINNEIARISAILNYAWKESLVSSPIQVGTVFKRVSSKKIRIERAGKDQKFFEANEIQSLIEHAKPQMKAMIMLGINCGYGNADCARLTRSMLSGRDSWLEDPRWKSGVWRCAWLWPETVEALRAVTSIDRSSAPKEFADLVFLTRHRKPWWVDGKSGDAITGEFAKLRKAAGVFRKQVGFYSLRHVTQTIGEQAPGADAATIRIIMGHIDGSISAKYRERYDSQKIKSVCEHVREWFLKGKTKPPESLLT